MLFDSHGHLNSEDFDEEKRQKIAGEIEEFGKLSYLCDVGFDLESSYQAVENANKYPFVYAVIGIHPHDAQNITDKTLEKIEELAKEPKVKAIGEIGLDYHYEFSPKEEQREVFRKQIRLANKLKLPIVVHSRNADLETITILKEEGAFSEERCSFFPNRLDENEKLVKDARVLIHCYSGNVELAKEYVRLGASLSFGGTLTFKNNKKGPRVVKNIPIEYLLIETDTPYLTPEPFRGRENRPYYVEYVAKKMAEIKELSYERVADITLDNARRFFNIRD